jgi:hypothetical protein
MTTNATAATAKTGKGINPSKVTKIISIYKGTGVAWDDLVEPVQDALIQEFMRYYDRWCKCVCRACGCQSKDHMGAKNGCPAIGNTRPLSVVRIIDLCCDQASEERVVSTEVLKIIQEGASPRIDPAVPISYTRPHYEPAEPEYIRKKKGVVAPKKRSRKPAAQETLPSTSDRRALDCVDVEEASPDAASVAPTSDSVAVAAPVAVEAQVQAAAQEMATHFAAALAQVNQRNEANNEAIASVLRLLGGEVQSLRAENEAMRLQASQALDNNPPRDPTAAAPALPAPTAQQPAAPAAAPILKTNQRQQQAPLPLHSRPQQQRPTLPVGGPIVQRSVITGTKQPAASNSFRVPTQRPVVMPRTMATSSSSSLYPPIRSNTMAPRLVPLGH